MTPLAPFGESNLVFSLSSICSLQYMFLSISPGGPRRQKECYPDLSLSLSKELLSAKDPICDAYPKEGWNT